MVDVERDVQLFKTVRRVVDGRDQDPNVYSAVMSFPAATGVGPEKTRARITLRGPWPNPVRGQARFIISLEKTEHVRLEVIDLAGRLIRTLVNQDLSSGSHEVSWDGRDERGQRVRAGVYLTTARAGNRISTVRVCTLE